MTKCENLDVLIVYNGNIASSASEIIPSSPFDHRNDSYNVVYGYFLETCDKLKLTAGFTTSNDIIGPGFCKCYWKYVDKRWIKYKNPCYSALIFDKFSPTCQNIKTSRRLLFSNPIIKPFNDPGLFNLFFDKQKTYEQLSDFSIPTISLDKKTLLSIKESCNTLKQMVLDHPNSEDFSSALIMKDRYGSGGHHVYKFLVGHALDMLKTIYKHPKISFIIQPFVSSISSPVDIRLIYFKGTIIQSYTRIAKRNEFRCNEHCGGLLTYLPLSKIADKITNQSKIISEMLNQKRSLFTLDFILGQSGKVYLLEGNSSPGLDWNMSQKNNETNAKKLIKLVVRDLASRALG